MWLVKLKDYETVQSERLLWPCFLLFLQRFWCPLLFWRKRFSFNFQLNSCFCRFDTLLNLKLTFVMYKPLLSVCSFVHMSTDLVAFYFVMHFNNIVTVRHWSAHCINPTLQGPDLWCSRLLVCLCFVALLKFHKVRSCLSVIWCLEQDWWTDFHKIYTHYFHWKRNIKWS